MAPRLRGARALLADPRHCDAIGSAETILEANIMGGMCSRVCPVEILCEDSCVRNHSEDKPVQIGALQRYATDALVAAGMQPFVRAPLSGKKVAVVGGGPAGLSAAHRLSRLGHDAVPQLVKQVGHKDSAVRTAVLYALTRVATKADDSVIKALGAQIDLDRTKDKIGIALAEEMRVVSAIISHR